MRQAIAMMVCAALVTTGCASASGTRMTAVVTQPGVVSTQAMAEYVQKLPAGSRVRVERVDGSSLRGTLMKAAPDAIVVQKNTRVPEPPLEIPLGQIARVTVDNGGGTSTAKAVAIGIASGVGAFFAILAIAFAASVD
jgi:hypothetical protein